MKSFILNVPLVSCPIPGSALSGFAAASTQSRAQNWATDQRCIHCIQNKVLVIKSILQSKSQTLFHKKSPPQDYIRRTLIESEKILKSSMDSIPSPSLSVKIQIMSRKVCLRCKGKTLLSIVHKLLKTKGLLTSPSNVLPYYVN